MLRRSVAFALAAFALGACATPARNEPTTVIRMATAASGGEIAAQPADAIDIDTALNRFLAAEGDALILLPHKLDKNKLDFSVESLKEIDSWLQAIHTINRLEAGEGTAGDFFKRDGRGDNSVMFAGLYLGEVVRQNAEQKWLWQSFEAFSANNPLHAEVLGAEPGFDAFVLVSPQGVATPGSAALKRVLNGPIDSVHYVGSFLLKPVDLDVAMRGTDMSGLPPVTPPGN